MAPREDNSRVAPGAPLSGRSVVVTRARAQAAALVEPLEALGAEVIAVPVIEIVDPPEPARLDEALRCLGDYEWIVLSSANGVDRVLARLEALGLGVGALNAVRVAVVGAATAARLTDAGVTPDLVPDDFRQEGLVEAFAALGDRGGRVLFARALEGRFVLGEQLEALGYEVDLVPAYRTVPAQADPEVIDRLALGVDVITFTSPSTVRNFIAFLEANGADPAEVLSLAEAASIGPVTTAALVARGIEPAIEPAESTVPALVAAIAVFYSETLPASGASAAEPSAS